VHFLCLEPRETDKNVLKFSKNWVLKFHFLLLGALYSSRIALYLTKTSVCCVGERSSTGRLEWDTKNEAIDALVMANHTHLPNPSM